MNKLLQRMISAVRLRCPRCREGHLFTGPMTMNKACPNCGLVFEPEPGFYLGSIYANYAATVLLTTSAYLTLVYAYRLDKNLVLGGCVLFAVLFPLWFFRYARSIWFSLIYSVSSTDLDSAHERDHHDHAMCGHSTNDCVRPM